VQIETTGRTIERFRRQPHLIRLECGIQHYDWGDPDAIPHLLGTANPERRPFAELWAGAHPDLPSTAVIDGIRIPLDELISETRDQILGRRIDERFGGELPFLLKVLAAGKPLSIQAHPDDAQARAGYDRENRAGLPLNAATRSYHDPHHKPELLVALTDFYVLRGFRPLDELAQVLSETPELAPLDRVFRNGDGELSALYGHVMHLNQGEANTLLSPLLERLEIEDRERAFPSTSRWHWLLRADREYSAPGHRDLGLFSVLLLNLVRLRPGQAMFLPAGELHAYLRGVGIELMANSNNVLRGGLTHKYVDVEELLRTLSFRAAPADLIEGRPSPDEPGLTGYPTPAGEFALCRLELSDGGGFERVDGEMALVLVSAGDLSAEQDNDRVLQLLPGQAFLAPAGVRWRLRSVNGGICWIARVPSESLEP
jgi:mannose-6-phosphate isomerase class I